MEYLLLQRFNKFFLNSSGDIEEMERVLLFLAENSDEKLQQIYQRDKKSIIKEYLQALTLNNYSDPPDLFKQVINTFAEKFVNNITSIQQIILKKTPDRKAIKPKNFETALKRYAQNKKRINWDFKTEGI
ncbi:hypothetical protein IJM86_04225 [bacterium]|nr:hypothetical protein [bacterium]